MDDHFYLQFTGKFMIKPDKLEKFKIFMLNELSLGKTFSASQMIISKCACPDELITKTEKLMRTKNLKLPYEIRANWNEEESSVKLMKTKIDPIKRILQKTQTNEYYRDKKMLEKKNEGFKISEKKAIKDHVWLSSKLYKREKEREEKRRENDKKYSHGIKKSDREMGPFFVKCEYEHLQTSARYINKNKFEVLENYDCDMDESGIKLALRYPDGSARKMIEYRNNLNHGLLGEERNHKLFNIDVFLDKQIKMVNKIKNKKTLNVKELLRSPVGTVHQVQINNKIKRFRIEEREVVSHDSCFILKKMKTIIRIPNLKHNKEKKKIKPWEFNYEESVG